MAERGHIYGAVSRPRNERARFYVLQVERGHEAAMAQLLTRVLPASAIDEPVFEPTYSSWMKLNGAWTLVRRPLLPGYLIAVSGEPELLQKSIDGVVEFCRVLGTEAGPVALPREAEWLFGGLAEPGARCLPVSVGYKLSDGSVAIAEGPLMGHEGLICHIDRHKRIAILEVALAGERIRAHAGLAVLPLPEDGGAFERRLARAGTPRIPCRRTAVPA